MQKKKARKGFLFLRENLCCRLVGRARVPRRDKCGVLRRDTWVPPYRQVR